MSTARVGAASVLAGHIVRLTVSGVSAVVIALVIGPAYKGLLATLGSIAALSSTVIGLGTGGALPYYVATRRWSLAQANTVAVSWTLAAAVLAWWGFGLLRATFGGVLLEGLGTAELVVATSAMLLASLAGQTLLALKEFKAYARFSVLGAAATPALFAVMLAVGRGALESALWSWIGAQVLMALACQVSLLHRDGWRLAAPNDVKGAAWYGIRSLGWDLLNLVNLRLDVLILRALSSATATGSYALAVQFAELAWLVPTSVGAAVFPEVAAGGEGRSTWTARVCRLTSALSTMLAITVGIAGSALIVLFLPRYQLAIPALWLLLPGTVATATGKILANHLNARGLPQTLLVAGAVGVVLTIAGDVLLVPTMGASGAGVVSSVSYAALAAVLVHYFVSTDGARARDIVPRWADAREAVLLGIRTARETLARGSRADAA